MGIECGKSRDGNALKAGLTMRRGSWGKMFSDLSMGMAMMIEHGRSAVQIGGTHMGEII